MQRSRRGALVAAAGLVVVAVTAAPSATSADGRAGSSDGLVVYTRGLDSDGNGTLDGGSAEEASTDVMVKPAWPGGRPVMVNPPSDAADVSPSFSPDGTLVAWASGAGGTMDVWVRDLVSGQARNLTGGHGDDNERWPVFSPDGRHILYSARSGPANLDIWVMRADGSQPRRVAGDGEVGRFHEDCCASWSPDGRSIVFASNRAGNFDLYRYDLPPLDDDEEEGEDATRLTRLTTDPAYQGTPSYLADGTVVYRDGAEQRVMRLDPRGRPDSGVPVTDAGEVRTPEGSPAGDRLVYGFRRGAGDQLDLVVSRLDGSGRWRLTSDPAWSETEPSWQPVPAEVDLAALAD